MTENHSYETPSRGASDWHLPLNENFEAIDTDVEVRDSKARLSEYAPKDGSKFHATDTREIYLGDGSEWHYHGVLPETTDGGTPRIKVFGANAQGQKTVSSGYPIADFDDIGDAIQTAHDDLVTAGRAQGGWATLPVGQFDFSTPIEINIPFTLIGHSGTHGRAAGQGDLGMATRLNWTGGSGPAVVFRGADDSPVSQDSPDILPGIRLEGVAFSNYGGDATTLVYLDGTSDTNPDGSVIRRFTVRDVRVSGATGADVLAEGTVFQGFFENLTIETKSGPGLEVRGSDTQLRGGPSQWYFYNPWFRSAGGGHSLDIESQQVGIFGGTVTALNGGNGIRAGFRGAVWGTNIEGTEVPGSIGACLHGAGPWHFHPATCSRWESGLSIGDPANKAKIASNVRFSFASRFNESEDVIVQAGGQRNSWTPLVDGLTITDRRLSEQNVNEKNATVLDDHTDSVTVPVDSTGAKSVTLHPAGQESYDSYDSSIVATDDGSGGNVSDFVLGEPIVQDLDGAWVDASVPVTTASATDGATATLHFEFKRYT